MEKYRPPCMSDDNPNFDQCGNPIEPPFVQSNFQANLEESDLNRALADKFIFVFDLPCIMKNLETTGDQRQCGYINQEKVRINIRSANIPSVEVESKKLPYSGHTFKVSSHARTDYIPLNLNMFIDKLWDNYWLCWKWLDILCHHEQGFFDQNSTLTPTSSKGVPKEYMTTMSLIVLDGYNQPKAQFNYENCFITSLGAVQVDFQQTDELSCDVVFDYSRLSMELL